MPLDLILFAIVAVFFGWRLYLVLGRRTGNERTGIDPLAGRGQGNPARPGARISIRHATRRDRSTLKVDNPSGIGPCPVGLSTLSFPARIWSPLN